MNDPLEWEFGSIAALLEYDEELSDAFFAAKGDEDVLAAMKRQMEDGAGSERYSVIGAGFRVLKYAHSVVYA